MILGRDLISFHLVIKSCLAYVQLLHCMRNVASVFFESIDDDILLDIGDHIFQGTAIQLLQIVLLVLLLLVPRLQVEKKFILSDYIVLGHKHRSLDDIFQLANIARPVMFNKAFQD